MSLKGVFRRVARRKSKDVKSFAAYEELYEHFSVRENETRILHLWPSHSFEDDIRCDLNVIDLSSEHQAYVALSYSWGDEPPDHSVCCNGLDIAITKSCVDALRVLRQQNQKHIWIDQISINQRSLSERGSQVALMSEIFRIAKQTYVFLGLLDDLTAAIEPKFHLDDTVPAKALGRLIEQAEEVGFTEFNESLPSPLEPVLGRAADGIFVRDNAGLRSLLGEWNVCVSILKSRYLSRMWPVQEVVLSRHTTVLLGGFCFSYQTLVQICWDYYYARGDAKRWTNYLHQFPTSFGQLLYQHSKAKWVTMGWDFLSATYTLRWDLRHDSRAEAQDPVKLLARSYNSLANESLDYIFAIRALFPMSEPLPAPNYSQDYTVACIDHSKWMIRTGWAPSMLTCGSLFLDNFSSIPSWTINFGVGRVAVTVAGRDASATFVDGVQYLKGRASSEEKRIERQKDLKTNAFWTVSGETVNLGLLYPCGAGKKQPSTSLSHFSSNGESLMVEGFSIDIVLGLADSSHYDRSRGTEHSGLKAVWDFYREFSVETTDEVRSFITQAGWWEKVTIDTDARMFRLISFSVYAAELHLFYMSGAAERSKARSAAALVEYDPELLYDRKKTAGPVGRIAFPPHSTGGQQLGNFVLEDGWPTVDGLEGCSVERMVFGITREGWPVLVPHTTRAGDTIAFFHGVSLPWVLRDCSDGTYRLRGRCHVLGLMYGWGWTEEPRAAKNVKTFTIV